ncbi:GNAT family N-acetyltransferase [Pseudoalteromonas sp. SSDWG2]|uniref:GNAT family N-acetyltransferase n=1 Tax=Pseudoalteromonas sp. SSDWG2 TaxID=3139391 RepID=UPI003BAC7F78
MTIPDSDRLSYRLMTLEDGDLLFELDQDPAVMEYINGGKVTSKEEINTVMLPRLASYLNPQKGWGLWQVTEKSTQQFLGWVLVRPYMFFSDEPQWHNLELGWRFKQISWGKGFATEAAKHIMNTLAKQPDISAFCAIAVHGNVGSIAVMKKLGMQYVKSYTHADPMGDWDVVYYQTSQQ